MSSEQFEFPQLSEVTTRTALDVMFKVLESKKYTAGKTSEWADQIGNGVIEKMRSIAFSKTIFRLFGFLLILTFFLANRDIYNTFFIKSC